MPLTLGDESEIAQVHDVSLTFISSGEEDSNGRRNATRSRRAITRDLKIEDGNVKGGLYVRVGSGSSTASFRAGKIN